MQFVEFITDKNAIIFILLFARISGVFAFFPFFNYVTIPISIKTALALYLTFLFFPDISTLDVSLDISSLTLAILSELMLGFISALALMLVFAALQLAGMQISMVMGFSMSTIFDPSSGSTVPIMSQFFTILAILMLLAFDGHHMILVFLSKSFSSINLGGFVATKNMWEYLSKEVTNMFVVGFLISFPVIALSLLADIIFGMLMKTMPQFNLLVVGFPIKIFLSFMVLTAVLGSILLIFKKEFMIAFNFLKNLI